MENSRASTAFSTRRWTSRGAAMVALLWTVVLGLSLLAMIMNHHGEMMTLVENEARANLDKDLALRQWATSHGGVYVPVDGNTPPNPYLSGIPERDIVTPGGRQLTLMNPAYMLRQTMTFFADLYGVKGRITSLQVLNPANAPDAWEEAALRRFDAGERMASAVVDVDGKAHFRLFRAMIMEPGCIKCHLASGVKVGGVRGGIGVAVPMAPFIKLMDDEVRSDLMVHGLLWLGGLAGIGLAGQRLKRLAEQRDRAQMAVGESEERYRRIVETAREGVWVLDCNGVTVYANAVMARLAGWPQDEMAGRPATDFLPVETAPRAVGRILDCGDDGPSRLETSLANREQGPIDVIINASPLSGGPADQRVLCMVTDISGMKRGEEHLLAMVDKLSKSNAELERFAQVASHDLQEPLRSIISFAQLLERNHKDKLDGDARECIDYVIGGARRMHELVNDLLVYSSFSGEAGRFRSLDGGEVAAAAVANLRQAIDEAGAEVTLGQLPAVVGDAPQVVQLFQNLLSNSLKFRPAGQPPRIRIDGSVVGGEVEFTICDNGIGIEPEYYEEIFRIFRRLHPPSRYGGTGMGLAICRRIIDRHGGRIWVVSEPGRGSTFHFTLPAAPTAVPAS